MNLSFWERESYFKDLDVIIIGSGIVGLNAALELKRLQPHLRITILERGILPMGASSRNAGFACFGSPAELLEDLKKHSENELFSLIEKRWKGLLRLRKNLGDGRIDFHNWGGYDLFDNRNDFMNCADQLSYLNRLIAPITGKQETYQPSDESIAKFGFQRVEHLIVNTEEAQIDTGKMIHALIDLVRQQGIEIINGFTVQSFQDEGNRVQLFTQDEQEIVCKRLIIATNGFAKQLLPGIDVSPARAQVLVTHPIKNLKLKGTFHYNNGYYYFRNIGDRVLFGGGRNLDFQAEETIEFGLTTLVQDKLDDLLKNMILPYTDYTVDMRWSGIMGMGAEKKSIVKSISANVFCAVRMGGMGVAIGTLIGEEVATLASESI
jgi:glycine/D-amino acid oxidase-like deaminating enzyme